MVVKLSKEGSFIPSFFSVASSSGIKVGLSKNEDLPQVQADELNCLTVTWRVVLSLML